VTTRDDDNKATGGRKERVLHTRVPAVLEQELKRLAESLKVPVSNVVRTILEDTVSTIDSVGERAEGELRDVAARLREHRDRLRKSPPEDAVVVDAPAASAASDSPPTSPPLAGVVGYQPLLLARDEQCSLCGRTMAAGDEAFLGVRETASGPRVLLDKSCLPFSAVKRSDDVRKENDDEPDDSQ
jgi:hypothetical protein